MRTPPFCRICGTTDHVSPSTTWPEWYMPPKGTAVVWVCNGCYTIIGSSK